MSHAPLQYRTPAVAANWAESRETHPAVAMAIHALSGPGRSPEQIWEAPTNAEFDQVAMTVENYVDAGVFDAEDDGRYLWGMETIVLGTANFEVAIHSGNGSQSGSEWDTDDLDTADLPDDPEEALDEVESWARVEEHDGGTATIYLYRDDRTWQRTIDLDDDE